jgi:hypothetical protein
VGWRESTKGLMLENPLIIHHIFNWTNNPVVAGINHQFSCISQLIGF